MRQLRGYVPDGLFALVLLTIGLIGTAPAAHVQRLPPPGGLAYVCVVVGALAVIVRRRLPTTVLAICTAGTSVYLIAGNPYGPVLFSLAVALYTVAAHRSLRFASVAAGAVFVVLLACDFIGAGVGMDVVGPIGAWAAAPLAIGVVVRVSREQVLQTRRDDARRRDDDARRQADEERLRVAQEVHDVVGHGLAAITMQAEIALHLMERERSRAKEAHPGRAGEPGSSGAADPASGLAAKAEPSREQEAQPSREQEAQPSREEEAQPSREEEAQPSREQEAQPSREQEAQPSYAEEALKAISRTSRESLEELRAALGAVRRGDDLDDRAPTAGLALLEALVDRTRAVGVPVAMDICGPIKGLPIVVDLTAYRIVQESLTNVLRHAGPASAAVDISVGDDEVTIEVTDDGHAAPSDGDGDGYMSPSNGESDGHGLAGMRERVTALGGSLTAGPRPEGGFAVSATLPVRR